MATWNVRGLNGKEYELIEEMINARVDILGITEIKKKGKGVIKIQNHILLYSGVTETGLRT